MQTLTEPVFTAKDEVAIRGMFDAGVRFLKAGDWNSWAAMFSRSAFLKPAAGPTIEGRPELLAWGRSLPAVEEVRHDNFQVAGEGNFAYATSTLTLKLKDQPATTGKQLAVLRRGPGPAWKVVAVCVSPHRPGEA